jgi:dual-specificity kinase
MRELVAIKVVRSVKKYREAAMLEVDVLQLIGKYDRTGSR